MENIWKCEGIELSLYFTISTQINKYIYIYRYRYRNSSKFVYTANKEVAYLWNLD